MISDVELIFFFSFLKIDFDWFFLVFRRVLETVEVVGFDVKAPFMIMFVLLSFFEVNGLSSCCELIVLQVSNFVFFDLFCNLRFEELFRESPEPLE